MTHIPGHNDSHLHHEDGSHRITAPTSNGDYLVAYEAAIRRHLDEHARQNLKTTNDIEDDNTQ